MLTRRQDELFSHAARLALRGTRAAKDGEKPSSLKPLLESWSELESMVALAPGPARKVAQNILSAAGARRSVVTKANASHDELRVFGTECVLLFKIARGDNPASYPLEFGDYF